MGKRLLVTGFGALKLDRMFARAKLLSSYITRFESCFQSAASKISTPLVSLQTSISTFILLAVRSFRRAVGVIKGSAVTSPLLTKLPGELRIKIYRSV
jgi:hypothetical protein